MKKVAAELSQSKSAQSNDAWGNDGNNAWGDDQPNGETSTAQIRGLVFGHFDSLLRADLSWCKKATAALRHA